MTCEGIDEEGGGEGKRTERREREDFAGVAVEGGWESKREKESESGERILNSKLNK